MPIYTIIATAAVNGHQHVTAVEFDDDTSVLDGAKHAVTKEHPSVAVARGSGAELEFLGVFDRQDDGSVTWTPED